MSIGDNIALGIIAFALACAVRYMIKRRKSGCGGCPYAGSCGGKNCERKKEDERSR